jgi:DnaJ domain
MLDFYEVLQVSPKAEQAVIEAAYKKLAQKYHPDRNPDPLSVSHMQDINLAYATLRNPAKRQAYDLERENATATVLTTEETEFSRIEYDWNCVPYEVKNPFVTPQKLAVTGGIVFIAAITFLMLFSNFFSDAKTVTVNAGQALVVTELLFRDDFDTDNGANWLLERPWHLTERVAASGGKSLWIGNEADGSYSTELNATAVMVRPLDLSLTNNPVLAFRLRGQTDNPLQVNGQDRLVVEVAEPNEPFQNIYTFASALPNWELITVDLSQWKGKTIFLRFRFQSGIIGQGYSGTFIDDVQIRK